MRIFLPALALLATGLHAFTAVTAQDTAPARPGGQTVTERTLHDRDYAFTLQRIGRRGRLIPEAEIQKLLPDAVAGASWKSGLIIPNVCYGVVIVEPAAGADIEGFADLILANMNLEKRELLRREKTTYCSRPAIDFEVRGRLEGMEMRYAGKIFLHQGFAYQVLAWGYERLNRTGKSLHAFHDSFALTDEPVRARTFRQEVKDTEGVGWRVRNGKFESAVYRFEVTPPADWRFLLGDELEKTDPEAEIAFAHRRESFYATVTCEAVPGVDHEAFIRRRIADIRSGPGNVTAKPDQQLVCGGRSRSFMVFEADMGMRLAFFVAVWIAADISYTVVAWYPASTHEMAEAAVSPMLAAIRILDDPAAAKLTAALTPPPDVDASVGRDFALRGGVYRDFRFGVIWKRPAREFWRLAAGQAAREFNEECRLFVEAPALGLYGALYLRELTDPEEAAAFHEQAVSVLVESGFKASPAESTKLRHWLEARSTRLEGTVGGLPLCYRLVTSCLNDRACRLEIWGTPGAMAAAAAHVESAVSGLEMRAESLQATEQKGADYVDHRLGFAVRPKGGPSRSPGEVKVFTPEFLAPTTSLVRLGSSREGLVVAAIFAMAEGQDCAWFLKEMTETLKNPSLLARPLPTDFEPCTFAGIPAQCAQSEGDSRGDRCEVYLLAKDRRLVMVVLFGSGEFRAGLRDAFVLLD